MRGLPANRSVRDITYLSQPSPVSMADHWFEIADVEHFWIRRRFEVLQHLAGNLIPAAREMAEIGCGHGLLQLQIESTYGREVSGFDLNDAALKKNLSEHSGVFCYDIFRRDPALRARFDLIFLFDVLEHIDDEDGFLQAAAFHLAPNGSLIINVPSGQWMYSVYDRAAGHKRRYSISTLGATALRNGMQITNWSYWGMPLMPLLIVRKLWLAGRRDEADIISAGFDPRGNLMNRLLTRVSRCEPVPQKLFGTSLMAVLRPIEQ